jgi:hypothetical protein
VLAAEMVMIEVAPLQPAYVTPLTCSTDSGELQSLLLAIGLRAVSAVPLSSTMDPSLPNPTHATITVLLAPLAMSLGNTQPDVTQLVVPLARECAPMLLVPTRQPAYT